MNSIKTDFKKRREKIIKLIHKGVSIPRISKRLGIGKSTIYYHYKEIKGKKLIPVKIPSDDKIKGEFLGAFSGDGSFFYHKKYWHYTIAIHLHAKDDRQYANYLKDLIKRNFNKKVREYLHKPNGLSLIFYSKDIFHFIDKYLVLFPSKSLNISIKPNLDDLSEAFLSYFIRGLIDTDGHVRKDGRIILALISKNMIEQASLILKRLGINHKIHLRKKKPPEKMQYAIEISKKAAKDYLKLIGFSNKRKEIRCASRDSNSRTTTIT